jgi:23S rRNA (adenine2503-C2)-methyltransferase
MTKPSFYNLTFQELKNCLIDEGLNPFGARVLFNWVYKKKNNGLPNDLAKKTKDFINSSFNLDLPHVIDDQFAFQNSQNSTQKFLIQLKDYQTIECVLIPFQGKYTLCLSSQVGCGMKCSFCYTGTQGLTRQLKTSEIVGQLMATHHWLKSKNLDLKITNIVFMGQGEPLHNFEAVHKTCLIFLSQYGLSIGREKITISTAGYLPGLKQWRETELNVNIALSLHSTRNEIRNELIPLNKAYPLEEVLALLEAWPLESKRFITFEYLLIKNLNDDQEDARELGKLLDPFQAIINLIPFNNFPGSVYHRPSDETVENFQKILHEYSSPTMIRKTKGDEILAACGQLNTN